MHEANLVGHTLGVRVVKRESHTKDITPNKTLVRIDFQPSWIIVPTSMEEICGDFRHMTAIQYKRSSHLALADVNDTHDDCCLTRPFVAFVSTKDRPLMHTEPSQTR